MSDDNAVPAQEVTLTAMPTVDDVIEAMKDVIDPELMVNVVDLDTQTVLEGIVKSATINWVWLPPWGLERITDDGRAQLQAIGFNV